MVLDPCARFLKYGAMVSCVGCSKSISTKHTRKALQSQDSIHSKTVSINDLGMYLFDYTVKR
jgi:aminopeptidase-like protein